MLLLDLMSLTRERNGILPIQSPPLSGITARKGTSVSSSGSFWGIANVVQFTRITAFSPPFLFFLHFCIFFFYPSRQFCSLVSPRFLTKRTATLGWHWLSQLTKHLRGQFMIHFHAKLFDDFIPIVQWRKLKWVLQIHTYRNPGQVIWLIM